MRISSFAGTPMNNPFIKPIQKSKKENENKKEKVSFGNYYSVGRGQRPAIRILAEQTLEKTEKANPLLADVLLKLANDLKSKSSEMMKSDNPSLIQEAKGLLSKAEEMIKDIETEIMAYARRKETLSKF